MAIKVALLVLPLAACGSQVKELGVGQEILCVKAPVGYIVPDDVYISKLTGPVYVRCPKNTYPALVQTNKDGSKTIVENPRQDNPGPPSDKPEYSTAGGGFAGAGTPNEISVAGNGKAMAIEDGVTTNSTQAKDLVRDVMAAMESLKEDE